MPRNRRIFFAAAFICMLTPAAPRPAEAQSPPAELRRRVDAFVTALREMEPLEKIASFFPRRGSWECVGTPHRVAPGARVIRQTIEPGNTLAAIQKDGPLCSSVSGVFGEVGPCEGTLVEQAQENRGRWRHVRGTRFVPPGHRADSPNFLEWIREDGGWVILRVGEKYWYTPRVLGGFGGPAVTRDTTVGAGLPMERRFARRTHWHASGQPIVLGGRLLSKYGLPRALGADELERFGSVGPVPVFVERGDTDRPEVVYVPVAAGEYEPYQNVTNSTCRD